MEQGWDNLDRDLYFETKEALRGAEERLRKGDFSHHFELPVVLINKEDFSATCYYSEFTARDAISKYVNDWDDEPPEGENEDLIVIKYYDEETRNKWSHIEKKTKFYKEINGVKYYKQRSFVECEPDLVINIMI